MSDAPVTDRGLRPAAAALTCAALAPLCAPLLLVAPALALRAVLAGGEAVLARRALVLWAVLAVIFGGYTWLVLEILVG